jgi:UDP:flavonoid glycosyltransferase YjiC (YdhE family)
LMAGAGTAEEIRDGLLRVLYDQEFRRRIERSRGTAGGQSAAARSAEAIVRLMR